MSISTEDCKELLSSDPILRACGALEIKGWKRLAKKSGALGVERVFAHGCGVMAKVIEAPGGIYIASTGNSLAALDDPNLQRSVPSALAASAAAASIPAAAGQDDEPEESSPLWTKLAAKKMDAAKARKLSEKLLGWEDDHDESYEKAKKLDPIAWANQFVFAVAEDCMCVSPKKYFEDEGWCYDQQSPIDHLMPDGSGDVNGCGTWEIPFDGTRLDLAMLLMAKGFHWDAGFQELIDGNGDFDGMGVMAPLVEQRELERTTPQGKRSKPSASL